MVYKVLWGKMLPIKPGTSGRTPLLSDKKVHRILLCVLHNTQVSALLKDTSVTAGTRTNTLLIKNTRVWIRCSSPLGHDTPYVDAKLLFYSPSRCCSFQSQSLLRSVASSTPLSAPSLSLSVPTPRQQPRPTLQSDWSVSWSHLWRRRVPVGTKSISQINIMTFKGKGYVWLSLLKIMPLGRNVVMLKEKPQNLNLRSVTVRKHTLLRSFNTIYSFL